MEQITDIDGKIYKTVKIGNQIWMAENLNISHYRNSDPIPQVQDNKEWGKLTSGAWCYYKNDKICGEVYGKLYNWYTVIDARGISPEGWHVPTENEMTILFNFLGGIGIAGDKLKETDTDHWNKPYTGNNETGFSGLPGGHRSFFSGSFDSLGSSCQWWSASEYFSNRARTCYIFREGAEIKWMGIDMASGYSVRCLRD